MVKLEGIIKVSKTEYDDNKLYRIVEGSMLDSCIIALLKFVFEPSLAVRAAACSQVIFVPARLFLLQLNHILSYFRFKIFLPYGN